MAATGDDKSLFYFKKPLVARRFLRKMRGGAQSHLLEAEDGHWYVVKFSNNPQHRRILVNEVIAYELLRYLGLTVPENELIHLTTAFLIANPEVHMTIGTRRVPVQPGLHFGSRYPGDPARTTVYDFLPDDVLSRVVNLAEFLGILVFDKWMANSDGRQPIFHRARVQDSLGTWNAVWVVQMIDHGFVLGGGDWTFVDLPSRGIYPRLAVYRSVRSLDDFQPWLGRLCEISKDVLEYAVNLVPPDWIVDEKPQLKRLIDELLRRTTRVPDLVQDAHRCYLSPFPNWQ